MDSYDDWWHRIGSGMRPTEGEDREEFVHRMTREAWLAAVESVAVQARAAPPDGTIGLCRC